MNITADGLLSIEDVRHVEGECPHKVEAGDVLFNNTNSAELVGKTALIRESSGYAFSNHMTRIRCKSVIEPAFLAIQLNTMFRSGYFQTRCNNHVSQASISASYLRDEVELAIPPLAEQRRIVAKIEELMARSRAARAALAEVPTLLEQFRQSVLASAFRGDLTADWREKNPTAEPASVLLDRIRDERRKQWETKYPKKKYVAPEPVDESDLSQLPEGWCWATIGELSEWVKDGTHWPPATTSSGVPFIGIRNVIDGEIDWATVDNWVSEATHASLTEKYPPTPGDVLYTAVGATFGRAFPIRDDRKFIFQRHIAHVRPLRVVTSEYLIGAINSPYGFEQSRSFARGAAQPTVTLTELKKMIIPLCPFEEQEQVAKAVERMSIALGNLRTLFGILLDDFDTLDQSILAGAFRGELVPQDPADEPAAALLARIRSGGGATTPSVPTRSAKRGQVKAYILLLLRMWNKPLGREMLERGLVLMLNADVRRAILGRSKTTAKRTKKNSTPPQFVSGMDALLGEMLDDGQLVPGPEAGFFAEGQHGIDFTAAPPSDLDAVRETAEAMKVLHKDKQQATDADIVSALNGEIYELVS